MVCFLTGYASCAASASLPAWPAHRKARSAPRAHVRELLCVSQSSKERLRRSRTESSGAAPAIEELAGEARQVRPAGPRAEKLATRSSFLTGGEVWRALGPPVPASIKFSRKFAFRFPSERAPQKSEISALVLPSPIRRSRKFPRRYRLSPSEEVWRAPGPPVPPSNIFSQKISLPPQSRPHAAGGKRKKAPHRKFRCDAFDSMGGNASETFPGMNG